MTSLLDRTRVPLSLDDPGPLQQAAIGERLASALGVSKIPVARWFDMWEHLRRILPKWDRLDFHMQHQQQTNWCWAAVSTSVALYYDPASSRTQCSVANGELGRADCCGSGARRACNVYGFLNTALTRVGHFDRKEGAAAFRSVHQEIDAGRPVGIRVAWSGGGAHFLAIIGYLADAQNLVAVDDPMYGRSDLTFDAMTTNYQGIGTWTTTYYTKA